VGTRIRGFSISKTKKYFSIFGSIHVPGTDQCSWFLDAPDSPHSSQWCVGGWDPGSWRLWGPYWHSTWSQWWNEAGLVYRQIWFFFYSNGRYNFMFKKVKPHPPPLRTAYFYILSLLLCTALFWPYVIELQRSAFFLLSRDFTFFFNFFNSLLPSTFKRLFSRVSGSSVSSH